MSDRDSAATPRDVTLRRNPFELWVVITCMLTGLVALLPVGERNGVVDRYLPAMALPWYVGLILGGLIAALSVVRRVRTVRDVLRSLALERIGLLIICGLMSGYGGALMVTTPRIPTGLLMIGLAVASGVRVRQISSEIADVEATLHDVWRGDDTT